MYGIGRVALYASGQSADADIDMLLVLNRDVIIPSSPTAKDFRKVFWYQNSNEYDILDLEKVYDGIMFASDYHFNLMTERVASMSRPIQFCKEYVCYSDAEEFPELAKTKDISIVYLGNNIKGPENTQRYLVPAIPFGLEVYGSMWESGPMASVAKGPLRGLRSSAQLYANADIVLSFHLDKQRKWNMPVCRPTEAMLCNTLCITDSVGQDVWGGNVIYTKGGDDLAKILEYWKTRKDEIPARIEGNRRIAIEDLSIESQAERIAAFLTEVNY